MSEFIEASHKVIEIQQGDLALIFILSIFIGGFCIDAAFQFFKFVFKKNKGAEKK